MERGQTLSVAAQPLWTLRVDPKKYETIQQLWIRSAYIEVQAVCRDLIERTLEEHAHSGSRVAARDEPRVGDVARMEMWAANRSGSQIDCLKLWDEGTRAGWMNPNCIHSTTTRGWALGNTGRAAQAMEILVEILARGEQSLAPGDLAEILFLRGFCEWQLGLNPSKARRDMLRALSIFSRLGDDENKASVKNVLAILEIRCFCLREADRLLTENTVYFRQTARNWHLGYCLMNHAVCQLKHGRLRDALAYVDESELIVRGMGHHSTLIHLNLIRAKALLLLGRSEEARIEVESVRNRAHVGQHLREESIAMEVLGDAALAAGDFETARDSYDQAMLLARRIGGKTDLICGVHRRMGELALAEGAMDRAIEAAELAIKYAAQPSEFFEEGSACHLLARCHERMGQWDKAYDACRSGIAILRDHGATLPLSSLQVTAARVRLKWWAESQREGQGYGMAAAESIPLARDECPLPAPPGMDEVFQRAHLEASWSYVVEAFHAFSELGYEIGRNDCIDLMEKLRREAEPPWRSSSASRFTVRVGGRGRDKSNVDPAGFIAGAPSMAPVMRLVETATATDEAVLITGETGTGKELIARMVHSGSHRADAEFVAVNCAAVPATLFEREFFGHTRGAYTGAAASRPGICQRAEGGTLFLDEIGEMPMPLQVKLLRLLQEGTYRRLGDPDEQSADLRILAATNADLTEKMERGQFRADLYYRLRVLELALPPLRRRREDVGPLVELFARRTTDGQLGLNDLLSPEALAAVETYSWPGNIRELGSLVHRLAMTIDPGRPLGLLDLPVEIARQASVMTDIEGGRLDLGRFLAEAEKARIMQVLTYADGNRTRAADLLGISRNTLYTKMRKLDIRIPVG